MRASRRDLLFGAFACIPVSAAEYPEHHRIIAAPDLLSQESAAGYRAAVAGQQRIHFAIGDVPSASFTDVIRRARHGALVIRELAPSFHNAPGAESLYVQYRWPAPFLIRSFGRPSVAQGNFGKPVAFLAGKPVAWKRNYGVGAVITLASMLGPHLAAGDREAQALLAALIRQT